MHFGTLENERCIMSRKVPHFSKRHNWEYFCSDCADSDDSCEHWKSEGYCNKSSVYHSFTLSQCPLSCGGCTLCPIPPAENTALPPTKLVCAQGTNVDNLCIKFVGAILSCYQTYLLNRFYERYVPMQGMVIKPTQYFEDLFLFQS